MTIEIRNLTKHFGDFTAVDDVSMRVEEGSLTALLGPSGSGKTTVLRMIAGLEVPDAGHITVGDRDVTNVRAQDRNIGFVFQQYALFKHMRVADNIAFPLKVRKWKKDAIRERVAELLSLLHLDGLDKRFPNQISGGQRQRVALARALASHPQVLLLDEPFSALDARVRDELREWLLRLHEELHVTSVFVTHDQGEAMELADSIVVMNHGKVAQTGSPIEIAREPNSPFVMNFLGRVTELHGEARHGEAAVEGLRLPYPDANGVSVPVVAYVRPRSLALGSISTPGALAARVERVVSSGDVAKIYLVTEAGSPLLVELDLIDLDALAIDLDGPVFVRPRDVRLFPVESTGELRV
jgi:sulfate transport system ATP-binding protein